MIKWTYNECLSSIKEKETPMTKKAPEPNAEVFESASEKKWVLEIPHDVRDEGMNDVLKAYQSNFAKRRLKKAPNKPNEHLFDIERRSKKNPSESNGDPCQTLQKRQCNLFQDNRKRTHEEC